MRRRGVKGGWTRTTRREGRKREEGRRGGGAGHRVAIPSSSKSELPLALISQLIAAALLYFAGIHLSSRVTARLPAGDLKELALEADEKPPLVTFRAEKQLEKQLALFK